MPATPAARAEDLTKVYGAGDTAVRALDGVTASFAAVKFTAIIGPSGWGKSTLMRAMAGLDAATSGAVWMGDTALTAAENITLPLNIAGRKPDAGWFTEVVAAVGLSRVVSSSSRSGSGSTRMIPTSSTEPRSSPGQLIESGELDQTGDG